MASDSGLHEHCANAIVEGSLDPLPQRTTFIRDGVDLLQGQDAARSSFK